MRFLNWNTEWAKPESRRGTRVTECLANHQPDVACLTEAYPEILPEVGNTITSSDESGYENEGGRRKVILWSRDFWSEVWQAEETDLPGGRFVSGVTAGYRVVGLCIPWSMAHVTTGRRDRKPWEDHLAYLEALVPILAGFRSRPEPLIVTGDWNQRIPRTRQPEAVYEPLIKALSGLDVVTAGILPEVGEPLIDHIALSSKLSSHSVESIPKRDQSGGPLSDHTGLTIKVERPG